MLVLYILIIHSCPQTHTQTSRKVEPSLLVLCYMGECVSLCASYMYEGAHRGWKRISATLELQLQEVVIDMSANNQTLMFGKAANTLKH